MTRKSKFIVLLLAVVLVLVTSFSTRAEDEKKDELNLTIEEAVKLGIKNSIDLRQIKNEIDLSALKQERSEYLGKKLKDGEERIEEGEEEISEAQQALNNGIAPVDITLPDGTTVLKGTSIDSLPISDEMKQQIKSGIEQKLDENKQQLESGKYSLTNSLQEAGSTLSNKLNFDSLDALNVESTSDLITTMANVSYEVTRASYDIYKNKIAMLIQKNYYDVLKAQKILEVKKKAMDRGKKQYEFAKAGYETGMKAKDDMLLAEVYYKGTQIEYEKARGELQKTLVEFKKSLNIPLDTKVVLTDVLVNEREIPDLEKGVDSGLKNRLEIKKALGEVGVYDLNFELTKRKYPDNTFQYREAKLLKEKARINYEKTYSEVKSSIRKSYETLKMAGEMLEIAKDMTKGAKESVEIAEYKYKEGFGAPNSFLKKLDLESAAGTIVEVLAAEENLAEVEEKVIEIIYGYNLAKMKYYNDIGKFIY
jgi:hypothetical protein